MKLENIELDMTLWCKSFQRPIKINSIRPYNMIEIVGYDVCVCASDLRKLTKYEAFSFELTAIELGYEAKL